MSVVCFCVTTWESCIQLDEPMQSKTVASALANLEKKKTGRIVVLLWFWHMNKIIQYFYTGIEEHH